jgi:hypothetical protein
MGPGVIWGSVILLFTASAQALPTQWKVALVAGDSSTKVFDNARVELGRMLFLRGIRPSDLIDLSASEDAKEALPATPGNLRYALKNLQVGKNDACLLHLTSHGSEDGLDMESDPPLTPAVLDEILRDGCGDRPTVLLISACYSGIFLAPIMERPNRIILTAARQDRSSFGCDDRGEYNFWDECLLDYFPLAGTWRELYPLVTDCIRGKEKWSHERRSYPQAFFGAEVAELRLPSPGWNSRVPPDQLFAALWDATDRCEPARAGPIDYYADDVCE